MIVKRHLNGIFKLRKSTSVKDLSAYLTSNNSVCQDSEPTLANAFEACTFVLQIGILA